MFSVTGSSAIVSFERFRGGALFSLSKCITAKEKTM